MNRLLVNIYDDPTYAGARPLETLSNIADVGLRWSIAGGLQKMEVVIRTLNEYDTWERYQNHLGHRLAVYDEKLDRYIGGQVYEVKTSPDFRTVTYVCAGPWQRANDDVYNITMMSDISSGDDTDVVVKDIIDDTGFSSIVNSDQTNIDGTNVNIGGWVAWDNYRGKWTGDAIEELAAIGDSNNNPLDFYLVDALFRSGVRMDNPIAYLKARSTTASPDWVISRQDLAPSGISLSRNIWKLARAEQIHYGRIGGTDDGGAARSNLQDGGASFTNGNVAVGDEVVNITQNKTFTVQEIVGAGELQMSNASATNWDNGDAYSIRAHAGIPNTRTTSSETGLWTKEYKEERIEMDTTQAAEYGLRVLATYEKPVQQNAFVISSPTIRDGNGVRWPLWRPLMGNSFYFRITDLFPEAAVFGASDDRSQTFIATAMDYQHSTGRLRVVPGTVDTRLDVLMQQALREKRDWRLLTPIISTATELRHAAATGFGGRF